MANQTIIRITSKQQIIDCVDLYLKQNDEDFVKTSKEQCYRNLFNKVRLGRFVRAITDDSGIIAWIYADQVALEHTDYVTVQQMYYGSSQHGANAVRCIKLLHEVMLEYAATTKAVYCLSAGSPYDESFTFARILEKSGWSRRGYLAVKKLKET